MSSSGTCACLALEVLGLLAMEGREGIAAHRARTGGPVWAAANLRERGSNLSVGQKQLLSFARALAADPDILILDEATSSVDAETEQLIEESIERLLTGRTSIVIAHRLSTVQRADVIIVLHQGEVREMGSHEELLQKDGLYAKLYRYQYGHSRKGAA